MKVFVDHEVFSSPEISPFDLVSLFHHAAVGRHLILPDPLDSSDYQQWLDKRDPEIRDECRLAVEASLDFEKRRSSALEIRVTSSDRTRWTDPPELPLEAALSFMKRPLSIVVENVRNDGAFLLAVADRNQRAELKRMIKDQWIRFDHGGGLQEMMQRLKESLSDSHLLRRSFWIFDSDALAPGKPSPESGKLKKLCRRKHVGHHQLERRAAENYLPTPLLRDIWARSKDTVARKKKVRAFEQLNASQRYHFNMKEGLEGDQKRLDRYRELLRSANIARDAEQLFANVKEDLKMALRTGFGQTISSLFGDRYIEQNDFCLERDGLRNETRPLIDTLFSLR